MPRKKAISARGRPNFGLGVPITWRVPGGPCWRAWIERNHGQAGARFLFSEQTDTIDGNAIGEPISAPVCYAMADLETLLAYVWATLESGR